MRNERGIALLALIWVVGCLSTAGKQVLVTEDRELIRECTLLGRVRDSGGWTGSAWGSANEAEAEAGMRNDVADLGGNVLLARTSTRGEAYRCGPAQLDKIRPQGPTEKGDPMNTKD